MEELEMEPILDELEPDALAKLLIGDTPTLPPLEPPDAVASEGFADEGAELALEAGETLTTCILLKACSPKLRTSRLSRETRISHHLHIPINTFHSKCSQINIRSCT